VTEAVRAGLRRYAFLRVRIFIVPCDRPATATKTIAFGQEQPLLDIPRIFRKPSFMGICFLPGYLSPQYPANQKPAKNLQPARALIPSPKNALAPVAPITVAQLTPCRGAGPVSTTLESPLVHNLAPELWVVDRPLRLPVVKAEIGTRMTIVRLRDRGLFLHSPVKLELNLRQALYQLGEVRAIAAPNRVHHLFVADYLAAYPQAKSYAAPGLESKRRDL
jgi:hypothetical protein